MPGPQRVNCLAERIEVHPDWLTRDKAREVGGSFPGWNAPASEDVARVFLESAPTGVPVTAVASVGYLSGMGLTALSFTVVGFGTDEFLRGNNHSPSRIRVIDGIRSYWDVTVITERSFYADRFLKVSQGSCFGDSGGPIYHGDVIVGVLSRAFSPRCTGPNPEYRMDSEVAHWFPDQ